MVKGAQCKIKGSLYMKKGKKKIPSFTVISDGGENNHSCSWPRCMLKRVTTKQSGFLNGSLTSAYVLTSKSPLSLVTATRECV